MKILIGCLAAIGGLFVVLIVIGAIIGATEVSHPGAHVSAGKAALASARSWATDVPRPKPRHVAADPCDLAQKRQNAAVAEIESQEYSAAYHDAVVGLQDNDRCDNSDWSLVNHAYLLSSRGLAEHYLTTGDSRTDLNQANQLLEECVTKPDLYGTSTAAGCETEQQNNISSQTNWDVYGT